MFNPAEFLNELKEFRLIIEEFKEANEYVECFFVSKSNGVFIDPDALANFITLNHISNKAVFNKINDECIKIIQLWNSFENKKIKPWNNHLIYSNEYKDRFYSTAYIFAFKVNEYGKFTHYNYIDVFIEENEYQEWSLSQITYKCLKVIKILKESFSDFANKNDETEKPIAKRIEIGSFFLSGEADKAYEKLKSWRKVAKHFEMTTFSGQFSSTAARKSDVENNVFIRYENEILDYCKANKIKITCYNYLSNQSKH